MSVYTQSELSAKINNVLQTQLPSLAGSTSNVGDEWIATGAYGGTTVYPMGSFGTDTDTSYYYPTFKAFNHVVDTKVVGTDQETGDNLTISSISPTTLTTSLTTLYGDIYYELSGTQQTLAKQQATDQADLIQDFSATFKQNFGTTSINYKLASETAKQSDWYKYATLGLTNLATATWQTLYNSTYAYYINEAISSTNYKTAVKSNYQTASQQNNGDELYNKIYSGEIAYSDVFTGSISRGVAMPFTETMANKVIAINNATGASNENTAQQIYQNARRNISLSLLRIYNNDPSNVVNNNDQYVETYTGGSDTASGFPAYFPSPGPYKFSSTLTRDTIQGTSTGGKDLTVYISASEGDTVDVGMEATDSSSYSYDASARYWFFSADASGSSSSTTDTTFRSHEASAANSTGTVTFGNSYYQSWDPPQSGKGQWLLLDVIEDAFTNGVSSGILPWTQSPKFPGGWGFTSAPKAKDYLAEGFSYIKSIAYSAEPATSVSITSSTDSSTFFDQETFNQSEQRYSAGIGFGDWLSSASLSGTYADSSQSREQTTTSSYDTTDNAYKLESKGIGSLNLEVPTAYGYGATQIGVAVNNLVAPMTSNKVDALNDGSSSRMEKYALGAIDYKIKRSKGKIGYFVSDKELSGEHIKFAGKKNDLFIGSKKEDHVSGSGGHDELYGWNGNDNIWGGGGKDFISGGYGKNYINGGNGADHFELDAAAMASSKRYKQIIGDFEAGKDVIWMTNNADLTKLSYTGKWITYDDEKVCKLLGATRSEMEMAIDTVESAAWVL